MMYSSKFPKEMNEYFNLQWDIYKIWSLDLPIEVDDVSKFNWQMDYPFWATQPPDKIFDLCPREILENLDKFPERHKKIMNVDTKYPIETMYFDSLLIVLDGFHRLAHHIVTGKKEISYRVIPMDKLNLIKKEA